MTSTTASPSLTAHLLSIQSTAHDSATHHPFLLRSGIGTIADSAVCQWLVQDKYYQLGYVSFIGALLSKLDLSDLISPTPSNTKAETPQHLARTTTQVLIDSLNAIQQEIEFYDRTAETYKLELRYAEMSAATREYVELFKEVGNGDGGVLRGLVVLWATEHVRSCLLSPPFQNHGFGCSDASIIWLRLVGRTPLISKTTVLSKCVDICVFSCEGYRCAWQNWRSGSAPSGIRT